MSKKFIRQGDPGLFDEFMQNLDVAAYETPLLRIGKLVDWSVFEPTLHQAVLKEAKGPGGRPRFNPMLMFKVLVLQKLHGLADDATSFQITDRASFRAFLGLTPGDVVPDGQTILDFKEALRKAGAYEPLFAVFLGHLQTRHGLALAKEGVMVDATFVEVPKQRNSRDQNQEIKEGEVPEAFDGKPRVLAQKDLDARWTKKNNLSYFGYKNHVKVDVSDKLILQSTQTTASEHDSQALEELISEGDQVVWADSAYSSAELADALRAKGLEAQICEKGTRAAALTEAQKSSNRAKSRVRSRVEHVFAQMTGSMRALWQRSIGYERNFAAIQLTNLVYNLLRFEQIVRLGLKGTYKIPALAA
jgi:IS5 family transposase